MEQKAIFSILGFWIHDISQWAELLTCVVEVTVGERQQWGVKRALRVPQDRIMLIDVLHNLGIEFIFLDKHTKSNTKPIENL